MSEKYKRGIIATGEGFFLMLPRAVDPGHYPTLYVGVSPVANSGDTALAYFFRRWIDNGLVIVLGSA